MRVRTPFPPKYDFHWQKTNKKFADKKKSTIGMTTMIKYFKLLAIKNPLTNQISYEA